MKKACILLAALGGSLVAFAQDKPEPLINRDFIFDLIHIIAVLLIIYLISFLILQLVRSNFDYRLKNKMLERQTDAEIVGKLLQTDKVNPLSTILKWVCTLAGVGLGFMLVGLNQPFGMHSLALMSFSVAAGLGLYYYLAKRLKN